MDQIQFPFPMMTPSNFKTLEFIPSPLKEAEEFIRQELLRKAKVCGVGIVHIHEHNSWRKGGMTVAFKKCNQYKHGRMVEVAVSVCSPEDIFSRKIGTKMALEKFFDGYTIELPLLTFSQPEDINGAVKEAFMGMWNAM